MDNKEAIQFLREQLGELPNLAGLPHDNGDYLLWRNQIEDVLKNVFSRDSDEYQRFVDAHPKRPRTSTSDGSAETRWYIDEIKARGIALKSIIRNYELFGVEEESEAKPESEDTAELPIYLFDKMQFHPEIVTASKSLFETKHYAEAIFEAFKAVENFVREKTGLSLYGKQLMATVFNEDNPLIQVTEAGKENKDTQEGFKFLFMGAMVGIRNPKAHYRILQRDPFMTLEYLGFASFLLKRIAGWQLDQRKQKNT